MKNTHGTAHDTLKTITNIKNIKTITNVNNLTKENNDLTSSISVGGVKVPKVEVDGEMPHLPKKWRGVKFDLFNNATDEQLAKNKYNYTLAMTVFGYNQTEADRPFQVKAKLNRTNLDLFNADIDKSGPHYRRCRSLRDNLVVQFGTSAEHISLNKFYQTNYRGGKWKVVDNWSAILMRFAEEHHLILIYNTEIYEYKLPNTNISKLARDKGRIGTLMVKNEFMNPHGRVDPSKLGL